MLIGFPDLPNEVLFGFSMIVITSALLWLIFIAKRKARVAGKGIHERIFLSFILLISVVIVYVIAYYRRELISFLSNPTVLVTLLVPISYIIYALYKRGPPYFRLTFLYPKPDLLP